MNDDECILGAKNRALAARDELQADYGFGLEGGVQPWEEGLFLVGWVAVVDQNGRFGIGGSGRLPLPSHIGERVLAGEELGPVMDDILQTHNIKQKGGAVGALTANLKQRQDAFELGVAYALGQFVAVELYES
jgi:inosine/xanthosine triphosphatase